MDELLTFHKEYCIFIKMYNSDKKKNLRDLLSVKWPFNLKKKNFKIRYNRFDISNQRIRY